MPFNKAILYIVENIAFYLVIFDNWFMFWVKLDE